jgi:hypothetical protein
MKVFDLDLLQFAIGFGPIFLCGLAIAVAIVTEQRATTRLLALLGSGIVLTLAWAVLFAWGVIGVGFAFYFGVALGIVGFVVGWVFGSLIQAGIEIGIKLIKSIRRIRV